MSTAQSVIIVNKAAPFTSIYDVVMSPKVRARLAFRARSGVRHVRRRGWRLCVCVLPCVQVPNKFRIKCRVSAFWPASVLDFTYLQPAGSSSQGSAGSDSLKSSQPSYKYFFTLCLEDGTGAIVVHVDGSEAEELLIGSPPLDFRTNDISAKLLDAKVCACRPQPRCVSVVMLRCWDRVQMDALVRPGTIFDCCVMSYWVPRPATAPAPAALPSAATTEHQVCDVHYKLFDTALTVTGAG